MEAVSDRGVRLTSWLGIREEVYFGGFFEKIVLRKLVCDMSPERLENLDKFRRKAIGH